MCLRDERGLLKNTRIKRVVNCPCSGIKKTDLGIIKFL